MSEKVSAGDNVNACLFWLEGLIDGTTQTREDCLAILGKAITELQQAYERLMYE